jgi:hypothetical protein
VLPWVLTPHVEARSPVADVRLLRDLIGREDSVVAKEPGLSIGIEPAFADFKARSDLTPEFIDRYVDTQIEHLPALGCDAVSCLVDLREIVAETVEAVLKSRRFDGVVVGAGSRELPARLILFEIQPCSHTDARSEDHVQHHAGRHCGGRAPLDQILKGTDSADREVRHK